MKTINLLMLCGIGDVLSHITRFPAMQEIFPDYKLKVFLGGFGRSPQFMKEILELEYYRDQLEKLQNQMVLMEKEIDLTTIIINIIEHEKIKVIGIENKIDRPDNK